MLSNAIQSRTLVCSYSLCTIEFVIPDNFRRVTYRLQVSVKENAISLVRNVFTV